MKISIPAGGFCNLSVVLILALTFFEVSETEGYREYKPGWHFIN